MYSYLKSKGISMQNTASYILEQNDKAKRETRTIVKNARTMIHARNLPLKWAEAVNITVYILNCKTSNKNTSITSYKI